jgi:hypothetical protein
MPVTVTYTGPIFKGNALGRMKQALINAASDTGNVVKMTAMTVYLEKKKSEPKLPSLIIDSFTYDLPFASDTEVRGLVFCDESIAPWAIYVDQPRTNSKFPGYFFMKAGAEEGEKFVGKFVTDEINKLMKG